MLINTRKHLPTGIKIFIICLIMGLLYFSYLSLRWAIADILSIQIRHQLGTAQTVGRSLDAKQWKLTETLLEKTLWLRPDFSGNLELAEFFYDISSNQKKNTLNQLNWHHNREKALHFARSALLLRPSSYQLWMKLLSSKVALSQFDSELAGALERTVSLGPWQPDTLYDIAFLGLDQWDHFNQDDHLLILRALDKTIGFDEKSKPLIDQLRKHINTIKLCEDLKVRHEAALTNLEKYCSGSL